MSSTQRHGSSWTRSRSYEDRASRCLRITVVFRTKTFKQTILLFGDVGSATVRFRGSAPLHKHVPENEVLHLESQRSINSSYSRVATRFRTAYMSYTQLSRTQRTLKARSKCSQQLVLHFLLHKASGSVAEYLRPRCLWGRSRVLAKFRSPCSASPNTSLRCMQIWKCE